MKPMYLLFTTDQQASVCWAYTFYGRVTVFMSYVYSVCQVNHSIVRVIGSIAPSLISSE